jgi:hypothetical protein
MNLSDRAHSPDERVPAGMTAEQRVLVQLAELLVATGDVLESLKSDDAAALRWIAPHVRKIHEAIDDAMSQLTH